MLHWNAKNEVGNRYGMLEVLASASPKGPGLWWMCKCDCGGLRVASGLQLRSRQINQSCGCQKKPHNRSHMQTGSMMHRRWGAMIQRCRNPKSADFHLYGGRGIAVCDRWLVFQNFLDDMGPPPPGTSIDRINNDGPYSPENCRWATNAQQANNRRRRGSGKVARP